MTRNKGTLEHASINELKFMTLSNNINVKFSLTFFFFIMEVAHILSKLPLVPTVVP
jgi:hypothetical protein